MKFPRQKVETVGAELDTLSKPDGSDGQMSKGEVIRLLGPKLRRLQRLGYGLERIAALLADRGIAISTVTLRRHLRRLRVAAPKQPATPTPSSQGPGPGRARTSNVTTGGAAGTRVAAPAPSPPASPAIPRPVSTKATFEAFEDSDEI